MNYYFNKTVNGTFEEVIDKVTKGLKEEGFGILTEIDVTETLKKVQEIEAGIIEVAAVNPMASMQAVKNERLNEIASEITAMLENVIEKL